MQLVDRFFKKPAIVHYTLLVNALVPLLRDCVHGAMAGNLPRFREAALIKIK
ncbi:hypothetical protein CEV33_2270 [Brucella grignonensis]|uniref:Uncharacterized protein n=1 Tax=Brucella grignonensis TaxID=94627 RepID=A0A256F7I2_9HYPH|nr:hypothetical protein CEV33_2270 [Brucella grignonensis]